MKNCSELLAFFASIGKSKSRKTHHVYCRHFSSLKTLQTWLWLRGAMLVSVHLRRIPYCMKYCLFIFCFFFLNTSIIYCKAQSFVRIVENGKPNAQIVISVKSSSQIKESAKTLQQYIDKASQAKLKIVQRNNVSNNNLIVITLGCEGLSGDYGKKIESLDKDGFLILFPDRNKIVIAGRTDWGTEFGVYHFIERYIGVRWLLPGEVGEYIPIKNTIDIPNKEIRDEPFFYSRLLSSPDLWGGREENDLSKWAYHNRMHGRIEFHHNLFRLFPPEKYTDTHPEFFPIHKSYPFKRGKHIFLNLFPNSKEDRYFPLSNHIKSRWQPCFTAPGIVEEAVRTICDYFSKHPEATSYSLGINDSGGHCEGARCLERDNGGKNFIGNRDLSDRYFEWANAVVEGVLRKYPDKWFGCLAYSQVAQPPSRVPVHPRIVPFMTYDRMKWIDKEIEEEGKRITELWLKKSSTLGWYDYIYGAPYLVPRVYFHKMAEYYKYGYEHGVRAMYSEAYPNWGEGPKLYIALKLQWNPYQDVDTLLNDWYVSAVGKDAAPYLADYYEHWENFWTKRVLNSKWFTGSVQYLAFYRPDYLDLVSYEDISKSRTLLETVLDKAETTKQRARAEIFLKAFEYYEASVISYLGLVRKDRLPGKDRKYYEDMSRKRLQLVNEFESDPVLAHPIRFDNNKWKINSSWKSR